MYFLELRQFLNDLVVMQFSFDLIHTVALPGAADGSSCHENRLSGSCEAVEKVRNSSDRCFHRAEATL